MSYELLLLLGVGFGLFLVPQALVSTVLKTTAPSWMLALHVALLFALYFIGFWRTTGQTLAMKTWKLKIVASDGKPPSIARLVARYLLAWLSILYFGAGLLWALFDRDRQFLHDRLAGTRIVTTD